jgi:hypothetical protein
MDSRSHPYNIPEEQRSQLHCAGSQQSHRGRVNCIVVGHLTVTSNSENFKDLLRCHQRLTCPCPAVWHCWTTPLLTCCLVLPRDVMKSCNEDCTVNRVVFVVNFIKLEHGWSWRKCLLPWNYIISDYYNVRTRYSFMIRELYVILHLIFQAKWWPAPELN